jgi:lysophospholipase L1-like esterase
MPSQPPDAVTPVHPDSSANSFANASPGSSTNACRRSPGRRRFMQSAAVTAAGLALAPGAVRDAVAAETWYGTWGAAPAGPAPVGTYMSFSNQTLRLIAHASIGGSRARVRLSNELGRGPVQIGAAWIGLSASGASLVGGSNRQLRFGGGAGASIAAGAALRSDPVDLAIPAQANLAVSLYLPGSVQAATVHDAAYQTSYVSAAGNQAASAGLGVQRTLYSWPFLTEIDIGTTRASATLIALGDSQTDGVRSTSNANQRWPDYLARRLLTETGSGALPVGVVNRGISGNRLLGDADNTPLAGKDALERFDRDVLATSGARFLVILIGINDIINSSSPNAALADQITAGYLRLVARARTRGMRVLGATLLPFEGYTWYSAAREAVRHRVNTWIRGAGAFDAVLDFDAAVRDPGRPTRLLPARDGGDHLHPGDAGYEAMARAVPLSLLSS